MYSEKQLKAAMDVVIKMSYVVPEGTTTGVVYAAMAQMMASHFAVSPDMTYDEIRQYMMSYTEVVLELVKLRRAHRELN